MLDVALDMMVGGRDGEGPRLDEVHRLSITGVPFPWISWILSIYL